jgi:hypothetical protein
MSAYTIEIRGGETYVDVILDKTQSASFLTTLLYRRKIFLLVYVDNNIKATVTFDQS